MHTNFITKSNFTHLLNSIFLKITLFFYIFYFDAFFFAVLEASNNWSNMCKYTSDAMEFTYVYIGYKLCQISNRVAFIISLQKNANVTIYFTTNTLYTLLVKY